jgi:sec-independent protein translocase protein TatA
MELMLILIIVLIIFGAGKIPQLGEGLGKAIKGFKKSVAEADALDVTPNEESEGTQAPPPQQVANQPQATQAVSPEEAVQQPVESTQPKQG